LQEKSNKQTQMPKMRKEIGKESFLQNEFNNSHSPPTVATIKSIFEQKGLAIHHFYELFELISTM